MNAREEAHTFLLSVGISEYAIKNVYGEAFEKFITRIQREAQEEVNRTPDPDLEETRGLLEEYAKIHSEELAANVYFPLMERWNERLSAFLTRKGDNQTTKGELQ